MSTPAEPGPAAACTNCGTALTGPWCGQCGQHHRRPRLDARDLAADAFDQVIGLDTKIGRTLVDLTLRPGPAALAYVQGRRARYVNPLKYMIFAVASYFLVLAGLDLDVTDFGPAVGTDSSLGPVQQEIQLAIQSTVNDGLRTIAFAGPAFFAWITGFFLGRGRFNFAECCSLWLFATAHGTLFITCTWLLLSRATGAPSVYWMLLPALVYYTWAARGFFGRGWAFSLFAVLVSYAAMQLFFIAVIIGCLLTAILLGGG